MKKSIIFGTAGHIDHGKSSLIKALTGKDPDRLKEEQEKGITIELGYAMLETEDLLISFIDVPGHEKLVKTMISGSVGFDAALFCVDAGEGVMPQTLEHFNILSTIGIKYAVAAITKADIRTPEQIEQTADDVRRLFENSSVKLVDVIPVSVKEADSVEAVKQAVIRTAKSVTPKIQNRCYVMRADRVFTVKGHGTVVTGTSLFGRISVDTDIYNVNTGKKARVKNIQVHDEKSDKSIAGQRTALNLPDFTPEDIRKGNLLSENPLIKTTSGIFAAVTSYSTDNQSELLRHNKTYPVIIGSDNFEGRIIFHDIKTLESKQTAVCFIKLDRNAAVFFGEPFIIRSYSPQKSVAGGRVMGLEETFPDRKNSFKIIEHFAAAEWEKGLREMVNIYKCGLFLPEPIQFSGLLRNELAAALTRLNIANIKGYAIDNRRLEDFTIKTVDTLKEKGSLSINSVSPSCGSIPDFIKKDLTNRTIETALKLGYTFDGNTLKRKEADPFEEIAMQVLNVMKQDPSLSNPALISEKLGMRDDRAAKCLQYLTNRSLVRKIEGANHATMELINRFTEAALSEAEKQDGIDLAVMKKHFDLPRKLMVPLMEQLDKTGLFVNKGNKRYLINR